VKVFPDNDINASDVGENVTVTVRQLSGSQ